MQNTHTPFLFALSFSSLVACGGSSAPPPPPPYAAANAAPATSGAAPAAKPAAATEIPTVAETPTGAASELHEIAPKVYKKLFDSKLVRIYEGNLDAGAKIAAHPAPDQVVYALGTGTLHLAKKDGAPQDVALKQGEAVMLSAETHGEENAGASPLHFIVFEIRNGELAPPAKGADLATVAGKAVRNVLDNERVRVREVTFGKSAKVPLYAHWDEGVYIEEGGKLRFVDPSVKGAEGTREVELTKGYGGFLPAEAVTAQNLGTTPVKLVTVELKPPPGSEPAPTTPAKKK